jgi:hypothetical protein
MAMEAKASMIIMSHLSDIQEMSFSIKDQDLAQDISERIQFIKYLIFKCEGDLKQEIDADKMYMKFKNI